MGQDGQEQFQVFAHGFGAAGEVDDQRPAAHAGYAAGEHGVAGDFEASGAQAFGDAWRFAIDDLAGRFGGDVTRGEAGAAAGEDEIEALSAPIDEGFDYCVEVIGDHGATADRPGTVLCDELGHQRAAAVLVFAAGAAVADG